MFCFNQAYNIYFLVCQWVCRSGSSIVVSRFEDEEHHDPAIQVFLSVFKSDIKQGQHVQAFPVDLMASMQNTIIDADIENLELDGEVCFILQFTR